MKRKIVILLLAGCVLSISACGKVKNVATNAVCSNGCSCTDCVCCDAVQNQDSAVYTEEITTESSVEDLPQTEVQQTTEAPSVEQETTTEQMVEENLQTETGTQFNEVEQLTEGEKEARRQQQANFAEARDLLYTLTNSKDKTNKINQMDRQILENNVYDFSKSNIVFIGDSITEGVTAAVDANGNKVSYTTYVNSYLHFQSVLNHGVAGRMFSDYGGNELSLSLNFGQVTNINSDIIVVFAGVNDYLAPTENKRYGDINNTESTAGYCGSVRYFMKQLRDYYSDNEIFFVTIYRINRTQKCTYSDITTQPTLNDYMEVQRKLAKEYGFHVIDLYNQGFMDCSTQESSDYYLRDGLHPKDNGNIVLGEHIAAELSLYFGQK